MSLSFNYRPDFYFSFAYQPQEKRVKTPKTEKCNVLYSRSAPSFLPYAKSTTPTNKKRQKIFIGTKKSHIWYFVQEWTSHKKMLFKTLYKPRPPYITAKLYLDWILKRWNIVLKGVVLIASLKSHHRSDLCRRASNPNNSLRCVQWRRIWRPWASKMSQIAVTMTCRIFIRRPLFWKSNGVF